MDPIMEMLPSWLTSFPGLIGTGLVVAATVLMALRSRDTVVHRPLDAASRALPSLPEVEEDSEEPTRFEQMEAEILAGRLVNAIKLYREETGLGLKEATEAVERMHAELTSLPTTPELSANPDAEERVRNELAAGRMINAIKLYREATGVGLREAKEAVERLQEAQKSSLPAAELADAMLRSEVTALLAEGRTIEAVKLTRQRLKLSLKQAKTYVELVQRNSGVGA